MLMQTCTALKNCRQCIYIWHNLSLPVVAMSSLNRILDPTFKESLATELVLSDIDEYKEEGRGGGDAVLYGLHHICWCALTLLHMM